jgi:DeoR/GlpR family transcriptional regulator of sugar metabolism
MTDSQDESTAEQILTVLSDGRANPLHLREQTGARKQQINKTLNRLQAQGKVEKVTRGLYELADDEEFSPPHATLDTESDDADAGELFRTLVEAIDESDRDAFGRIDPDELEFDTEEVGDRE